MMCNPLTIAVKDFLSAHKSEESSPVAISLSGGVDSMVICKILSKLDEINNISAGVIAIHIDYANREESGQEADYVENYCKSLATCSSVSE